LPAPEPTARERLPLALAAVSFSYNLNLGVLIRSAEAAGAAEVLLVGRDFFHRAAAMGADRWLELRTFETTGEMVAHARARGYQLVAVQQSPGAERFDRADYPPRPCLMLGSEGPGLPPELCAQADLVVEIPQRGEIDSLNVTAAAAIVLWACLARRGWV
jgi:tRNA G18 (ribose-2'-O)-methylase SpoU